MFGINSFLFFYFQREYLNELKKGLSKLPAPKNDYELILPDDERDEEKNEEMESESGQHLEVMDQADIEVQIKQAMKAKCKSSRFFNYFHS